MTTDSAMTASLGDPETRDAHKLYDAAITFVSMAGMYSPAVIRAVADRLAIEVQKGQDANEIAMMLAMVAFLAHESSDR